MLIPFVRRGIHSANSFTTSMSAGFPGINEIPVVIDRRYSSDCLFETLFRSLLLLGVCRENRSFMRETAIVHLQLVLHRESDFFAALSPWIHLSVINGGV